MKLKIIALPIIIALSSSAYADWFDGVSNGNAQGSGAGNTSAASSGRGEGHSSGRGDFNSWGTGRGDADGEVDFQITFKGKGRTDMDTKMSADGDGDWRGNFDGDGRSAGYSSGDFYGSGSGYNDANNGYGNNTPWRGGYPYPYAQVPNVTMPPSGAPVAPAYGGYYGYNYNASQAYLQQVQQQQAAQRKAMQDYLSQVQKQQQAFMAATKPAEKKADTPASTAKETEAK